MIVWELRLFDNAGAKVATFDQVPELSADIAVNAPAVYALRLNGDDDRVALFEQDGMLELWWADLEESIDWHREFCAFCIDQDLWTEVEDTRLVHRFISSGKGLEDLLARTLIATTAGSAESQKSGAGETVLKAFVDEQAGPSAGARARTGLTIEADAALGTTWDGQRTNKQLLGVCQEIAEQTGLQFGIARTAAAAFEFQVWAPVDRTGTVTFGEGLSNMRDAKVALRQSAVANYVRVGGKGEEADRAYETRQDPASIALSTWNRREIFEQGSDQNLVAELQARGDEVLAENRATSGFTFTAVQTPGCRYGKHYFVGDLVAAVYGGTTYSKRVNKAKWTLGPEAPAIAVEMIDA